jgi:hypothetical protein
MENSGHPAARSRWRHHSSGCSTLGGGRTDYRHGLIEEDSLIPTSDDTTLSSCLLYSTLDTEFRLRQAKSSFHMIIEARQHILAVIAKEKAGSRAAILLVDLKTS